MIYYHKVFQFGYFSNFSKKSVKKLIVVLITNFRKFIIAESLLLIGYYIFIEYSCHFKLLIISWLRQCAFTLRDSLFFGWQATATKKKEWKRQWVRFGPELVGRTSGRYAGYTFHSRNRSLVTRLLQWMFSQFQDESSVSIGDRSIERHDVATIRFVILRDLLYCSLYRMKSDIMYYLRIFLNDSYSFCPT